MVYLCGHQVEGDFFEFQLPLLVDVLCAYMNVIIMFIHTCGHFAEA